jgi:hypothetical protein
MQMLLHILECFVKKSGRTAVRAWLKRLVPLQHAHLAGLCHISRCKQPLQHLLCWAMGEGAAHRRHMTVKLLDFDKVRNFMVLLWLQVP